MAIFGLWQLILSALILGVLVGFTIPYFQDRIGRLFILFLGAALLWVTGFIFEITQDSLAGKVLFVRLQFIGLSLLPVLWLLLTLEYVRVRLPRVVTLFLFLIPAVTQVLVWFIPPPNLFWVHPGLTGTIGRYMMIDYDYGPWFYYVHTPYTYLLILVTAVFYVRAFLLYHRGYRKPIIYLLVAVALPLGADVLYNLGFSPFDPINPSPLAMGVSGLIIGFVLVQYRFFKILPIARSAIVETMDEGIIVLDEKHTIIDINRAVLTFFPQCDFEIGRAMEACERH